MKRSLLLAVFVVTLGCMLSSSMHAQPEVKNVMKIKLIQTQAVLEGLAMEDFGKIERSANALSMLSKASAWKVAKTPEYIKFSQDFQSLTDSLAGNAKARKLEAATLDYMQLTMLCVKCHTHSRKIGVASADQHSLGSSYAFNLPTR